MIDENSHLLNSSSKMLSLTKDLNTFANIYLDTPSKRNKRKMKHKARNISWDEIFTAYHVFICSK